MSHETGPQREGKPGSDRRPRLPLLAMAGGLAILIAGVVLVLFASQPSLLSGVGGKVATSPHLVTDRNEIDLGQVPANKVVKAAFKVTNAGDEPLKIVGEPRVELVKGC